MLKKLKRFVKGTPSLGVVLLGCLFLLLVGTNCSPKLNWLDHPGWDTLKFKSDPNDTHALDKEQMEIRLYLWAYLAEYNARNGVKYVIDEINFTEKSRSPLIYTATAFLKPNVQRVKHDPNHEGPHGHLIPPEPDPPGGFQ
jgi:hypothetical protein